MSESLSPKGLVVLDKVMFRVTEGLEHGLDLFEEKALQLKAHLVSPNVSKWKVLRESVSNVIARMHTGIRKDYDNFLLPFLLRCVQADSSSCQYRTSQSSGEATLGWSGLRTTGRLWSLLRTTGCEDGIQAQQNSARDGAAVARKRHLSHVQDPPHQLCGVGVSQHGRPVPPRLGYLTEMTRHLGQHLG